MRRMAMGRCAALFLMMMVISESIEDTTAFPETVAIGGLLALNSKIGRASKSAIQLALKDINDDPTVLKGVKLTLHLVDSNCSAIRGAAAALELMEKEVVAIAGPQSSEVAQFVAHMGAATQVPLISSATDPTLSESQYTYFFRLAHSDRVQMQAIAELVNMFEWKEVVAVYSGDDFGTNGVDELHDALVKFGATVAFRAVVDSRTSDEKIGMLLAKSVDMGGRIFVIHTDVDSGRRVLTYAKNLRMVTTGFIWIVTESISSVLDTVYCDEQFVSSTQGVLGTRSYIPESAGVEQFKRKWKSLHSNRTRKSNVNVYAYYAYDAVWMIAHALDKLLSEVNGTLKFHKNVDSQTDLGKLAVFEEGPLLLKYLLATNFSGITGRVEVDDRGDLLGGEMEVVNMVGRGLRTIGYWDSRNGFSVDPPHERRGYSSSKKLHHIVWPGGGIHVPRGWMIPKTGRRLVIGIPNKQGYKEFVDAKFNGTSFHGFCIDVFKAALSYLPYTITYGFELYGNGSATPSYDDLVEEVANKHQFDAAVGDITITRKRAKIVDFTQPYATSGLVMVVPVVEKPSSRSWTFLEPFSSTLWCSTVLFFLFTGVVIWLLERKKNIEFRGRPQKQVTTILWFIFSTLFFAQRERVKSTLGRIVLIIWLFVVLILISSYIASFTSILTVRRMRPSIQGISKLVESNVKIGYQAGSFVKEYLLQLNVASERLVALNTVSSYASALTKSEDEGGVGAIVDELPYVQLLVSSDCKFIISGEEDFGKSGWGFAFPKGSNLAADISRAILALAENGELQRIHETWLHDDRLECGGKFTKVEFSTLSLTTFGGLFYVFGGVGVATWLLYSGKVIWEKYKFAIHVVQALQFPSHFARGKRFFRSFVFYVTRTTSLPH